MPSELNCDISRVTKRVASTLKLSIGYVTSVGSVDDSPLRRHPSSVSQMFSVANWHFLAALGGKYEVVRELLSAGADPEAKTSRTKKTPRESAKDLADEIRSHGCLACKELVCDLDKVESVFEVWAWQVKFREF